MMDASFLQFPSHCHHCATILQHCHSENLMGPDGISKTMVWKKCAFFGTSQIRKRSHFGMPVPSAKQG